MNKNNEIINSLKRLDRIGDSESKTMQKIKGACVDAGRYVVQQDLLEYLPDYQAYGETLIDPRGAPIDKNMSRETALDFAKDIHDLNIIGVVIKADK